MSDCKDFEKYLRGEWYPGCESPKSNWRKDTEADFAARGVAGDSRPVKKPRKAVRVAKEPTVKRKRKPQPKWIPSKFCLTCQKPLRNVNESGYCGDHYKAGRYAAKNGAAPKCNECGAAINRKNSLGKCRKHASKYLERNRLERLKVAA
jgi:hypothetical protein